jgi:CheY-like chemotaxis protein
MSKTNENTYRRCVFPLNFNSALVSPSGALVQVLHSLIEATRGRIAQRVNSGLVSLYWQVGKRRREEVRGDERAAYGEQTPGFFFGRRPDVVFLDFSMPGAPGVELLPDVGPETQVVFVTATEVAASGADPAEL